MLAQEIVHGMSKPNVSGNIAIKLDMAKTYDRMDWNFLKEVLKRFGFYFGCKGSFQNSE